MRDETLPFPAAVMRSREMSSRLTRLLGGLVDPDTAPVEVTTMWSVAVSHHTWRDHGAVIYDIPRSLGLAFRETRFSVRGDDIQWPVGAFFVRAEGVCTLRAEDGPHVPQVAGMPVLGWYVMHSTMVLDDHARDPKILDVIAVAGSVTTPAIAHMTVKLGHEGSIEDAICDVASTPEDEAALGPVIPTEVRAEWLRIIVGTCAYLSQEKPDAEQRVLGPSEAQRAARGSGKKQAKRDFDDARLPVRYFRVGFKEVFDESLTQHFAGDEGTRKVNARFIVKGHYRQQAHGEKRALRRTQWIKPFWKGPTWGEVAARVVRVVDERSAP